MAGAVVISAEYALIPAAHPVLERVIGMIQPRVVFADDGDRYGAALSIPVMAGMEKLVSTNPGAGHTALDTLLNASGDVSALNAAVTPDTVAKYLLTSGSTSHPKGVITTQRMMCTNQAQLKACLPFLADHPPVLLRRYDPQRQTLTLSTKAEWQSRSRRWRSIRWTTCKTSRRPSRSTCPWALPCCATRCRQTPR